MVKGLKKYFPMIQTKGEILQEIRQKQQLNNLFNRWTKEQQKEFLRGKSGALRTHQRNPGIHPAEQTGGIACQ